jgi:transcription elongation factor Elf1
MRRYEEGIYRGKDKEGRQIFECPFCGKRTYIGRWCKDKILEDIVGCEHYLGIADIFLKREDDKNQQGGVK